VEARQAVSTHALWGELAWQLGEADGFALVQEADANGTSPGKDVLCTLRSRFAPCVVLLDEPVVYIRQFVESQPLSGAPTIAIFPSSIR
jgi:predicted AAA+ superfamily ATPase